MPDATVGEWAGNLRDRLLFALLAETGMRLGEALGLRICDFVMGRGSTPYVEIVPREDNTNGARVKMMRPRRVYVGCDLERLFADYLTHLACQAAVFGIEVDADSPLLVNLERPPLLAALREGTVRDKVSALRKKRIGPASWTPHWFRHSHATALLLAGTPEWVVSRRLVPLQATFAPSEASFGLLRWRALDGQNDHVAERVRVREIDDDEGRRLLRIVRRGTGSVVTWRRAQMVLLSAQSMPVAKIAEVTFTSADRVRDVIHNFNSDGFDSLYPKYKGGRPRTFTLPERREIKKIAKSKPAEHGLPFSTWSLAKLADFLVAEGVVDDISHEGLRVLLREEGVSFQRVKTWKTSRDPDYAAKKARVEHLY
ncbi:helix-turn-helix domain-containing protein, partial [Streptomyces sp. NBC_00320]|nr:helix-turn-helix domain-containing protein [Streptomyces sp. NBC_00320]